MSPRNPDDRTYVVAAATSRTGRAVVARLLSEGVRVRAIGRSAERLAALAADGAEPFVAEPTDPAQMTEAMAGADVVYVMLAPNILPDSEDLPGFQRRLIDGFVPAIAASPARSIVSLSGWGANHAGASGPVLSARLMEEALDELQRPALHVRAGWFMENLLPVIGAVAATGRARGPLRGDLPLPMIATADIGAVTGSMMLAADTDRDRVLELHGPADRTLSEAARIIGERLGRPDSTYEQESDAQALADLTAVGLSQHVAGTVIDTAHDINAGHIRMLREPSANVSTPTTLERFLDAQIPEPAA